VYPVKDHQLKKLRDMAIESAMEAVGALSISPSTNSILYHAMAGSLEEEFTSSKINAVRKMMPENEDIHGN